MNLSVAIWRRVSVRRAVVAMVAAVALLSGLTPTRARAQADTKPADPAPAAEKAADAAKPAEKAAETAKAPKAAKPPKPPEPSLEEQRKVDGIYSKRSNWLTFRLGFANRSGDLSGDGSVGYGVAYTRMLTSKYAFSAGAGHDVVGHFGSGIDEAVPFTGEFQRHYKWNSSLRPYVGVGGGYYFRKYYRTGGDYSTTTTSGVHLSLGFTSALDSRHVIGLETRVASLKGRPGTFNPTFGPGEDRETLWTLKVFWGLVY